MGLSRPPIERLMEKVEVTEAGCWQWTHFLAANGYARHWVDGKNVGAHRWSYEHHVGPIPDGLVIDHLCRNKACVNPEHLEPVTPSENVLRGRSAEAARLRGMAVTHCPQGHPYDEENTYLSPSGGRTCWTCKRQNRRAYYERNRADVIRRAAEWRLANPERSRELGREAMRRRRARKAA